MYNKILGDKNARVAHHLPIPSIGTCREPCQQAFLLDANVGAGIEVAALWLRLRRAAIWHRENPPRNDSFARERKKGSPPGQGDEAVEGEERDGSDLGLGGAVNFSNLGERSFKERDLGSSGVVSCEFFREVCRAVP